MIEKTCNGWIYPDIDLNILQNRHAFVIYAVQLPNQALQFIELLRLARRGVRRNPLTVKSQNVASVEVHIPVVHI